MSPGKDETREKQPWTEWYFLKNTFFKSNTPLRVFFTSLYIFLLYISLYILLIILTCLSFKLYDLFQIAQSIIC